MLNFKLFALLRGKEDLREQPSEREKAEIRKRLQQLIEMQSESASSKEDETDLKGNSERLAPVIFK